jgi:hypothetical protein
MNAIILVFNCVDFFLSANSFSLRTTVKDIISEMKGSEIANYFSCFTRKGTWKNIVFYLPCAVLENKKKQQI